MPATGCKTESGETPFSNRIIEKKDGLKILAIGNSFTYNGTQYLMQILEALGYTNTRVCRLTIGGLSLEQHKVYFVTDTKYDFDEKLPGAPGWERSSRSAAEVLASEDWDIVTLQQQSGKSGVAETYNEDLDELTEMIRTFCNNPDVQIGWLMTWAYDKNSDNADFPLFDNDQNKMYESICNAVQTGILTRNAFDNVIPAGTAVQNARQKLGDIFCADGYHLNDFGAYICGLTWIKAITGCSFENFSYLPDSLRTQPDALSLSVSAAEAACENLFEITESA